MVEGKEPYNGTTVSSFQTMYEGEEWMRAATLLCLWVCTETGVFGLSRPKIHRRLETWGLGRSSWGGVGWGGGKLSSICLNTDGNEYFTVPETF